MFPTMLGLILSAIPTATKLGVQAKCGIFMYFSVLRELTVFQGKHPLRTAQLAWLVHEDMCIHQILSAPEQETLL